MGSFKNLVSSDLRLVMLSGAGSDGGFWRIRLPLQYLREAVTGIVGGSAEWVAVRAA